MATMFRTVVGLDVGAHAIKAVVVKSALRGVQLVHAVRVEQPEAPLAERLKAIAQRAPLGADDLVTALPGHRVSTRLLRFPAGAARRIPQAVPFELENQIPFGLDELVVAYQRLPAEPGTAEIQVLAAAALASDVAAFLDGFAAAKLDPRAIDLDAAALAPLATAVPAAGRGGAPGGAAAGATAVVDFGASKTGIAVVGGGSLRFVRTVLTGGQAVTRALAESLGLPEAEAEQIKRELSPVGPADARARAAHAALLKALEPLVAELHKTLVAYRQTGGPEVGRLLLVGGGALLAGLDELLARALELPAQVVRPGQLAGVAVGVQGMALGPEYAPALALALDALGRTPHSRLNFRQGPFAYRKELAGLRRRLAVAGGLAAALVLLLGGNFYASYTAKARRYAALEAQVQQVYRELFPRGPAPANEVLALRAQTEALKKELAQVGGLAGSRLTPLDILAELSRRVPRDVRIDVQELVIERDRVRMRAETDSFESVDRIKAELLKFDQIKDVQVSDAKVNANQTAVGFRFTIALAEEV